MMTMTGTKLKEAKRNRFTSHSPIALNPTFCCDSNQKCTLDSYLTDTITLEPLIQSSRLSRNFDRTIQNTLSALPRFCQPAQLSLRPK